MIITDVLGNCYTVTSRSPIVEFCYWLQGAFELAQIGLTAEQIICVQKHLALVEATPQTGQPKQATDFCSWLRNGLDFISPGDARQVQAIRTKLNDCFEHAIARDLWQKETN